MCGQGCMQSSSGAVVCGWCSAVVQQVQPALPSKCSVGIVKRSVGEVCCTEANSFRAPYCVDAHWAVVVCSCAWCRGDHAAADMRTKDHSCAGTYGSVACDLAGSVSPSCARTSTCSRRMKTSCPSSRSCLLAEVPPCVSSAGERRKYGEMTAPLRAVYCMTEEGELLRGSSSSKGRGCSLVGM